jgi:aspartyl-tRNA(Asn)/glutamyl-tRNA(Gln) amidotransferase subunit A
MTSDDSYALTSRSLVETAHALATGEVSALEVTQAVVARAEREQPRLNCFIALEAEQALSYARQLDSSRSKAAALGPLWGVPLAHKDMFYRAGGITTCGSRIRADFKPEVTATVLTRLGDAGAVTVGRLNMAEFATGPTGHNVHYGACRNPWHTDYITGGSSSGSGSATAARIIFGALGSDTGGSVRLPAGACGLFGMKPTQTRISRFGAMGLSFSLDNIGPLARTARDCARLLQVISGRDERDPTSSHFPVADYEAATLDPNIKGLRIGLPRQYFRDGLDAQVDDALNASLRRFESLGAQIVEVEIPYADVMGTMGSAISGVEALALHRQWIAERSADYGPQTLARHTSNLAVPAADYLAAIQARPRVIADFVEQVFSRCDVLHIPVFPTPLPTIADTDVGDSEGFERVLGGVTRHTRPINYLALPSLSVPATVCTNGLPISFQLVGKPFGEARLLRAGAAYEQVSVFPADLPMDPGSGARRTDT